MRSPSSRFSKIFDSYNCKMKVVKIVVGLSTLGRNRKRVILMTSIAIRVGSKHFRQTRIESSHHWWPTNLAVAHYIVYEQPHCSSKCMLSTTSMGTQTYVCAFFKKKH